MPPRALKYNASKTEHELTARDHTKAAAGWLLSALQKKNGKAEDAARRAGMADVFYAFSEPIPT